MTVALTHCALQTADLEKSIGFYARYCSMEIVMEHGEGDKRVVWLASPGAGDRFVLVLLGGGVVRDQAEGDMNSITVSVLPHARRWIGSPRLPSRTVACTGCRGTMLRLRAISAG